MTPATPFTAYVPELLYGEFGSELRQLEESQPDLKITARPKRESPRSGSRC